MYGSGWELCIRLSLWMSLPLNLGAAYVLSTPDSWPGALLGLPADTHIVYRAMSAMLVGLLGIAYGWLALQAQLHRPLLALGATSKAAVFGIALGLWSTERTTQPLLWAGLVDLALANLWFIWLRTSRRQSA